MGLEVLTHTKRRNWKNCQRYFYHKHVLHFAPRKQKRGRRRGTIFGDLIFNIGHDSSNGIPELATDPLALRSYIAQALDTEYDRLMEEGMFGEEELRELEVERVKLEVMVEKYIERYGFDQRRELEFYIPLRNPLTRRTSRAFQVGGKIDGVIVVGDKRARIVEDKLVGQIQRVMIERLELDDQVTEYVDAFMSKGWDAEVAYRHTRFPGINLKPPKEYKTKADYPGETLGEFAERLRDDVEERLDFYFDEQVLSFPNLHMDDYRLERWSIAQSILQARRDSARGRPVPFAYPRNPSRCWEYGGCEFIPLCTKVEEAEALYVVEDDNPELTTRDEEGVTSEYGPTAGA